MCATHKTCTEVPFFMSYSFALCTPATINSSSSSSRLLRRPNARSISSTVQFFSGRISASIMHRASVPVPTHLRRWWCFLVSCAARPRIMQHKRRIPSKPLFWWMILFLTFLSVNTDCWYENDRHEEGVQVITNEPCLNCTCSRGALLCYLRVCPRLPNPPPSGCILLHRFKSCCSELICSDIPSGNSIEGRSELDPTEELLSQANIDDISSPQMKHACVSNGSIYAPGSAMDSSTSCEYCYCIGGSQKCIRPKCLLPLDGCAPSYDADDCCPARYNCTKDFFTTTSTTTLAPKEYETEGGCIVDGDFYPEGGKVLGIGHSVCDNCYCLRGLVRCEPLSCASPLLGCTPVIKTGECCAASYNCSGAIETQPEPNYGQFPTVSKDYAKLRKEVQHKRTTTASKIQPHPPNINDVPYYVIAESTIKKDFNKTGSAQSPFYYSLTENRTAEYLEELERKDQKRRQQPEIYYVATKVAASSPDIYREDALATTIRHKKYTSSSELKQIQNLLEERIIRGINTSMTTEPPEIVPTTFEHGTSTTDFDSVTTDSTTELITDDLSTMTTPLAEDQDESSTPTLIELITLRTVSNSTDCITFNATEMDDLSTNLEGSERHGVDYDEDQLSTTTEIYGTTAEFDGTTEDSTSSGTTDWDIEDKGNIATQNANTKFPVLQNILNLNKSEDYDADYDYNAPTLPPSLPNLRIIPFVAADAVDSKANLKTGNHLYLEEKTFPFSSQFSPPAETEGGFVPKEPPILIDRFYEDYHTTNVGNNGVTSLPLIPALTNPPKTDENNCMIDTKEVKHGESVTSEGNCALCVCFYGSIVCHEPQCPIPQIGCRNSNKIDRSTCCPEILCEIDDSPTLVLDSKDNTTGTMIAEPVTPADPFRDVIRTEPAPDLQLLIGDMSNYLMKQTTTTTKPEENFTTAVLTTQSEDNDLSFNKIWDMLFRNDENGSSSTTTLSSTTTGGVSSTTLGRDRENQVETRENVDNPLVGLSWMTATASKRQEHVPSLLKLAGCNIYGRMYRVGRIISELSGPCMECKCTEVGVQCENLTC